MSCASDGQPLDARARGAARRVAARAAGKLLVLVHGSCMNDRQWLRRGHDHGAALARDLGYTPRLRPLQQRPARLDQRARARRAARAARRGLAGRRSTSSRSSATAWAGSSRAARATRESGEATAGAAKLSALVCLGTPHHGAPLERGGNWLDVAARREPLQRAARAARQDPQRGRHRSALRQRARRALARPRPLRPSGDPRSPLPLPTASPATPSRRRSLRPAGARATGSCRSTARSASTRSPS